MIKQPSKKDFISLAYKTAQLIEESDDFKMININLKLLNNYNKLLNKKAKKEE